MVTIDFLYRDPKNLEIRTMSVEKTLEPLVLQVTTLVNSKSTSKKKKGKSINSSTIDTVPLISRRGKSPIRYSREDIQVELHDDESSTVNNFHLQ
jgi:hypothetical protein